MSSAEDDASPSLRRNRDFVNLWISESVSQFGSQISIIALPLLAVLTLDASPAQMGFLTAAGTAPFLVIGLFVGAWVDRVRRRPLMIAADFVRGVLLISVPVAWWLGALRIEMLYVVALLVGSSSVIFDVSWLTVLPSIVRRDQLVEANSKLQVSDSVAQVSGPGIGGVLVGVAGAPLAIMVDAVSFLLSAVFILRIRSEQTLDRRLEVASSIRRDIYEGLTFVFRHELLRAMVYSKLLRNFSSGMFFAVYVFFMADNLELGATAIGVVFATGGIGSLAGASVANWLSKRAGPGRSLVGGQLLFGVFGVTIPLAVLFPGVALIMLVSSELLQWMTYIVAQINELAIRQSAVPDRYLGRVNSVFQFFGRGMTPLGAISGGLLGEFVGVPITLVIASGGFLAAFFFVVASPIRNYTSIA